MRLPKPSTTNTSERPLEQRIKPREPIAAEAIDEEVRHRDESRTAEPEVHEPVVGIQKHELKCHPDSRYALLVNWARRAHGPIGVSRLAEVQKKLVGFAELAPSEEETLVTAD